MIVKNGFRSIAPQTASARRPPGRRTRRVSASAAGRVGHQHVAEPAQDTVDRVVVELDPLGVDHPVLDVARRPARRRGGGRRRASPARSRSRSAGRARRRSSAASKPVSPTPAASSSTVSPAARRELAQHPLPDRRRQPLDLGPAPLPARRDRLGDLVDRAPLLLDRLGAHPVLLRFGSTSCRAGRTLRATRAAGQSGVLPMRPARAPSRTGSPPRASRRRSCGRRSGCAGPRS